MTKLHIFFLAFALSLTTKCFASEPTVTYNLAGQRVNKDYKGIVVTNGKKYIAK